MATRFMTDPHQMCSVADRFDLHAQTVEYEARTMWPSAPAGPDSTPQRCNMQPESHCPAGSLGGAPNDFGGLTRVVCVHWPSNFRPSFERNELPTRVLARRVMMNSRAPHITGQTVESAYKQILHQQHDAALWRYAPHLTSDRARAKSLIQETLRHAWQQHPTKRSGATR